jgi:hypothetical protein
VQSSADHLDQRYREPVISDGFLEVEWRGPSGALSKFAGEAEHRFLILIVARQRVVLPKLTVRVRLPSSAPTTKALVQPKFCDPSDIGHRRCLVAAPPRLRRRGSAEACGPVDLGSAETTNHRESLCLNAYLMNHGSRSSIRVCLAGVASTVGCRAEMTTSLPWQPSVTEWRQAWRITRLTTCRPRQTLRRQEFPKQSIWRSEGCWTTPQSTRRTADSAVLRFRRL